MNFSAKGIEQVTQFCPEPFDRYRFAAFCGVLDEYLILLSQQLNVTLSQRGQQIVIKGKAPAGLDTLLQSLYDQASELNPEMIDAALIQFRKQGELLSGLSALNANALDTPTGKIKNEPVLLTRRSDLRGRSPSQKKYLVSIQSAVLSFGVGPAGTGKTYLAVACAVDALEREKVKKIILTRPAVEAGEHLGFLPGDLAQKIDPYLRPLYDALYDLLGPEKTQRFIEKQIIEIAPLAYMRGRTLSHAFIILDEAQNTTPEQMKMFLPRIGYASQAVITGDLTQVDLPYYPSRQKSGLAHALEVLAPIKDIPVTHFDSRDVVRHPLVAKIINAYEKWEADRRN